MAASPIDKSLARDRIVSAKRRLAELLALRERFSALPQERQQLTQEFFFHTVGAIEMVAQLVNQGRALGRPADMVTPVSVVEALPAADPIAPILTRLYANPKKDPIPADPYSDAGYVWRLWNYRHQVSHRGRNPFLFREGELPSVSLMIDPRNPATGHSTKSVQEELHRMLVLVERQCEAILEKLP